MFQHILVPLDGSSRAEQALPLAARVARKTGGTIFLLRAVPPTAGDSSYQYSRVGVYAEEIHKDLVQEANVYLERVAHSDLLAGITLHTYIPSDAPAQAILYYAQSQHADLIVLCSHGYTSIKRWMLGSVAQKIARHSLVPVVVLQEKSARSSLLHPEETHSVRALVALDGSPFAKATLIPTAQLVAVFGTPALPGVLHLLRVVQPPGDQEERKYQVYDINIREYNRNEAERYLQTTKERLSKELVAHLNLQVTFSVVEDADIATALMRIAETRDSTGAQSSNGYDLIALATHGRGGIQRWMTGSVAERLLEKAKLPLLIVRPL